MFDDAKRDVYRLLNLGTFARWQANYFQEVSVQASKSPRSKESRGSSEKLDLELDLGVCTVLKCKSEASETTAFRASVV